MSNLIHSPFDDVIVRIDQRAEVYEFIGTRAALEAEGVIPRDLKWPPGFQLESWEVGKLRYNLIRKRPNGAKGPRRNFLEIDWWSVLCFPIAQASGAQREVARLEADLKRARYRASAAGTLEWMKFYERYCEVKKDDAYRAFMDTVLGKAERLFRFAPRVDHGGMAS